MSALRRVGGYCPMGCGATLYLGGAGAVACSSTGCPRPAAVDELLQDRETEHIVVLGESEFTVRHPLRERLDDELMTCDLHQRIARSDGPPEPPGRYRVTHEEHPTYGRWTWSPA